ncbi:hypothetical protein HDV03_004798, partial [Kappamyces sp. JEL0829]
MSVDFKELKLGERTASCLLFTLKVKDFLKDRAELEKDYAKRLEGLVRKHSKGKTGKAGEDPDSDDKVLVEEWASTKEAWDRILNDTSEESRLHLHFADLLNDGIIEKLKALSARKEESRKKHLAFCSEFKLECEKADKELAKCKLDYDAACDAVDAAKGRFERATDDRQKEKLKRLWHQEILDMNNQKNIYLLTLHATNKLQDRHANVEIPAIIKQFEDFATTNNSGILKVWKKFIETQTSVLKSQLDVLQGEHFMIDTVDPSVGTTIPIPAGLFSKPINVFEPCGLWTDQPHLVTDEYSVVFLGNKLERLRKSEKALRQEIDKRKGGLEGLDKLYQSFVTNPLAGDAEVIKETIIDEGRSVFMLQQKQFRHQCFIDTIVNLIGEFPAGSTMHKFRNCSFAIPTTCDYCRQTIWGAKTGMTCKECAFNAHAKCEMKIAPTCSGVRGVIEKKKKRTVSENHPRRVASPPPPPVETERGEGKPTAMKQVASAETTDALATIQDSLEQVVSEDLVVVPDSVVESVAEVSSMVPAATPARKSIDLRVGCKAFVLYDYFATNPEEVNIHESEHVVVVKLDDGTGWTLVTKSGLTGIVPTSYIKGLTEEMESTSTLYASLGTHDHGIGSALYSFTKNSPEELSIQAGDAIKILSE